MAAQERVRRGITLGQIVRMFPNTTIQRLWSVESGYLFFKNEAAILCAIHGMDVEELFPDRHGTKQYRKEGDCWIGGDSVDSEAARLGEWSEEVADHDPSEDLDREKSWAWLQSRLSCRDAAIVLDYLRGWTLQEIGDSVDLTRERVRQIIVDAVRTSCGFDRRNR